MQQSTDDNTTGRHGTASDNGRSAESQHSDLSNLFVDLLEQLRGLQQQVRHLGSAKVDLFKASARQRIERVVLKIVALIVATLLSIVLLVLFLLGLSGAVAAAADQGLWFGQLIVGLAGICLLAGGTAARRAYTRRRRREETIRKYEARKEQHAAGQEHHDHGNRIPAE